MEDVSTIDLCFTVHLVQHRVMHDPISGVGRHFSILHSDNSIAIVRISSTISSRGAAVAALVVARQLMKARLHTQCRRLVSHSPRPGRDGKGYRVRGANRQRLTLRRVVTQLVCHRCAPVHSSIQSISRL